MLQPHFIGEDTFGAGRSKKGVEAAPLIGDIFEERSIKPASSETQTQDL